MAEQFLQQKTAMRILTLFLALFLTLLPESVSYTNVPCGQDVCLEEVCDEVEEEAIIRLPRRMTENVQTSTGDSPTEHNSFFVPLSHHSPIHFCPERLWLAACMLRL